MTALNNASKVYLGSTLADAVYLGATKVWPPLNPTTISGCRIWIDASQLALANGANVTSWPNLGAAPSPAIIGTPPPTFRTNAINGLPVVRITGAQGRFRFTSTGIDKDYTLIYVGRRWSLRVGRVVTVAIGAANAPNILWGFWGSRFDCAYVEGWLAPDVDVTSTTAWRLYSADATSTAAARLFNNGTLLRSGAATPAKGCNNALNICGHDDTSTEDADCEIAELLMYNRKLSDAERQSVENYLRAKWAVPTYFKPTDLGANLVGWFDASDASTVQITGSGVSQWVNKGVGALTLTQATDANRPTYANNTVTCISPRAFAAANSPASYDIILVAKPNANINGEWRTLLRSTADAPHQIIIEAGSNRIGTYYTGFQVAGGLTWDNVWGIGYGRIANSAAVTLARDGGAITTTTLALPAAGGAFGSFGAYQGPPISQSFGEIKEVIFVPYNFPEGSREMLEGYLAHKHGLTGLLPGGHRFKTTPP